MPYASGKSSSTLASDIFRAVANLLGSVPAAFVFRYVDASLQYVQTLRLGGNALDLALVPASGTPTRLVVGVDHDEAANPAGSQPTAFQLAEQRWEPSDMKYEDTNVTGLGVSRADLDKILYNVENLRKTDNPYGDDDGVDTPAPESEAPSTPA